MENDTEIVRNVTLNPTLFEHLMALRQECYMTALANHSSVVNEGMLSLKHYLDTDEQRELRCPKTFDGFSCWDSTPAGATAFQPCPDFIVGFDPRRLAFKTCTENGTWFVHPEGNKEWSNYTTCVDVDDLDFRQLVNNIYMIGYSISVAALFVSMVVFMSFRSLQCTRIRIHMHLFVSFAVNNTLWIVWYKCVVSNVMVLQENYLWCQALHVTTNYFMVANYMWMFCEGLHLHIALVIVFVKDDAAMRWFLLVGWILPFVLVSTYAFVRFSRPEDIVHCWMDYSETFWIITIPVLISLVASFVFLINVVRVLLTKLHPSSAQPAPLGMRKAARAAFILIPLFGLHYILIPFRPEKGAVGEKVYQVVSAVFVSLQGLCVSCLFCFTNHDVHNAIKMQVSRMFPSIDIAMTAVTGGESFVGPQEVQSRDQTV